MKRYGRVIGIKAKDVARYKELHETGNVPQMVLDGIKQENISNYSIYVHPMENGDWCIFSHFEYIGSDLAADLAAIRNDPVANKYMKLAPELFVPWESRGNKSYPWAMMEEVFYLK
jgi:L-rhamnose mutarotase